MIHCRAIGAPKTVDDGSRAVVSPCWKARRSGAQLTSKPPFVNCNDVAHPQHGDKGNLSSDDLLNALSDEHQLIREVPLPPGEINFGLEHCSLKARFAVRESGQIQKSVLRVVAGITEIVSRPKRSWALQRTQGNEKTASISKTAFHGSATLPFVITTQYFLHHDW
jgi:hypothetical protein